MPIEGKHLSLAFSISFWFLTLVFTDISLQDKMVIYDNEKQQIGWVPENCNRLSKSWTINSRLFCKLPSFDLLLRAFSPAPFFFFFVLFIYSMNREYLGGFPQPLAAGNLDLMEDYCPAKVLAKNKMACRESFNARHQ